MSEFYGQLYVITNIQNGLRYFGIVFSPGKTYHKRLLEHLSGKGSRYIWRDLQAGRAKESDFSIQLVSDQFDSLIDLREAEIAAIKSGNTLWPKGYNGNCGNQIVTDPEIMAPIYQESKRRLIEEVVGGPAWLAGREKMRQRHKEKKFTPNELAKYATHSDMVTADWASLDTKDRIAKSSKGNAARNEKITCLVCGLTTNKGNHSRWHGDNCKSKLK